ncbi:MAG: 50S ribosomal protein L24 [Patescibacteria group bacterium]
MKIRKGDMVKIVTGSARGKTGTVIRVLSGSDRIVVDGANLRTRHRRPRRGGEKGQTTQFAAPLHVSNAMLLCPKCGKPTRVGFKNLADEKVRVCRLCNEPIVK